MSGPFLIWWYTVLSLLQSYVNELCFSVLPLPRFSVVLLLTGPSAPYDVSRGKYPKVNSVLCYVVSIGPEEGPLCGLLWLKSPPRPFRFLVLVQTG